MATPNPHLKPHRALVDQAVRHLADQIQKRRPDLNYSRALALATQQFADELNIGRGAVYMMRRRGVVPAKHWPRIERVTGGVVSVDALEGATAGQ